MGHGFACIPHIGVYGDNYAPFEPVLLVRARCGSTSARCRVSNAVSRVLERAFGSAVIEWLKLDGDALKERERAMEESSDVLALKFEQKAEQDRKMASQFTGPSREIGDTGDDDAVAEVARLQEEEALQVHQCTGVELAVARRLVERCGGAADAIEYYFDSFGSEGIDTENASGVTPDVTPSVKDEENEIRQVQDVTGLDLDAASRNVGHFSFNVVVVDVPSVENSGSFEEEGVGAFGGVNLECDHPLSFFVQFDVNQEFGEEEVPVLFVHKDSDLIPPHIEGTVGVVVLHH